jgi:hypothetical protein
MDLIGLVPVIGVGLTLMDYTLDGEYIGLVSRLSAFRPYCHPLT